MGWDDVIRDGLAVAASILGDGLMSPLQHYPVLKVGGVIQRDAYGQPQYGAPVSRRAVVTDSDAEITNDARETLVAKYRIQFLESVLVDTDDRLVLADGRHAPILLVDHGVTDDLGGALLTGVLCG